MTASPNHDRPVKAWIVAAAIFLLVAGVGGALSYMRDAPEANREGDTLSLLLSHPESNDKMLPDVNTMIDRLADRLKTSPKDIEGWRMLGWSYFQTGRYQQAATAYARVVELDPSSAEFKRAYEDAKAKAAEGVGPRVDTIAASEAMPANERETAIRSMVEGLANRLESSPRDVEGWTLLMRSRVVLGEKEVAAAAFRKALEVFKDDTAASGKIAAAATELGLKAE
jgi:cytochrome c-type biogenesis protein CcmH/NrfG